jgi:hypothetical protein
MGKGIARIEEGMRTYKRGIATPSHKGMRPKSNFHTKISRRRVVHTLLKIILANLNQK